MTNVPYMLDEENQLQYLVLVWSNAPSDHHQLVSNQCIEGEGLEENKHYSDAGDTDTHTQRREDMMWHHGDNWCSLMTFQGQEPWMQATSTALWTKSRQIFDLAEAIWLVKIGYYDSPCKLSL